MEPSFGVIIGCCPRDLRYALGCYASVGYFMPGVPVCFLYDGTGAPACLRGLPNTLILDRDTVKDGFLRASSFGPGITKMISFFESPFDRFLFLDADTVLCGDLNRINDLDHYEFIIDKRSTYDDNAITAYFFDVDMMRLRFPAFDIDAHRDEFFCTGAFMARRNALSLSRYKDLLALSKSVPGFFKYWEMGMLNFMIFEAKDQGRCRVLGTDYQVVTNDYPARMLKSRFDAAVAQPDAVQHPVVYHFCGQKPFVFQNAPYTEPMTYFRLMFKKTFGTCKGMFALPALLAEDLVYLHLPALKRKARSAMRLLGQHGKRLCGQT